MIQFYDSIVLSEDDPPEVKHSIELEDYEEIAIGSELYSSFDHEDDNAELVQCCIQPVDGKWWVTPLKTNYGCYRRIEKKEYQVKKGETIFISKHYLTYAKNDDNSAQCYLRHKDHTDEVKVSFETGKHIVARAFVRDRTGIDDEGIGRSHCRITYKDRKLYLEDGGMKKDEYGKEVLKPSLNGTWIQLDQKTTVLRSPVTLMLGTDTFLKLSS